jgi:hypothetical protein
MRAQYWRKVLGRKGRIFSGDRVQFYVDNAVEQVLNPIEGARIDHFIFLAIQGRENLRFVR